MYQFAYSDVMEGAVSTAREREKRILERSIELLKAAQEAGPKSQEATHAIIFVRRVWQVMLDDLGREDNALEKDLKANLISIGIWILRECEAIRLEQSSDFAGLIEVSEAICDGLK